MKLLRFSEEYELEDTIFENENFAIYHGLEKRNLHPVTVKISKIDNLMELERDFEISRELHQIESVLKAEKILGSALIYERFGSITLEQLIQSGELQVSDSLELAIQIARAIEKNHEQKIIHKNLQPCNFLIDRENNKIKVFGFEIANCPEHYGTISASQTDQPHGALNYISPEQTGRLQQTIDHRTDLYAFGTIFYEILTGILPFTAKEEIELFHALIAKNPNYPHKLRSEIPEILSELVLKLLSKNVAERYQSAETLRLDLERCRREWETIGDIGRFSLGENDRVAQLRMPRKLFGRSEEMKKISSTFDRVCRGSRAVVLLTGASGVGKSALMAEFDKEFSRKDVHEISVTFQRTQQQMPYAALMEMLRLFLRQILTKTEAEVEFWRHKISAAVGANVALLVREIPELEMFVGAQPPLPILSSIEMQQRFELGLYSFMRICCQPDKPMLLRFDDTQHANVATLELISRLMASNSTRFLLVIFAYTDKGIELNHLLNRTISKLKSIETNAITIELQPLDIMEVGQLLSETLDRSLVVQQLTQLVFERTGGNPLFIKKFLQLLYAENTLIFDRVEGEWQCDFSKIRAMEIPGNVATLVVDQLKKLPEITCSRLKLAACIGMEFDVKLLGAVAGIPLAELNGELVEAIWARMILPVPNDAYRFAHDRLLQAILSAIPEMRKKSIHLAIGRAMKKLMGDRMQGEKLCEMVQHLDIAHSLIDDESEKIELAKLNLMAAREAKKLSAYEVATNYIDMGLKLLPPEHWNLHYSLALEIHTEATELARLNSDFDRTERLAKKVMANSKNVLDTIKIQELKIQSYTARGLLPEAIETMLEVLRKLRIRLPEHPTKLDLLNALAVMKFHKSDKLIDKLEKLPPMTDPHGLATARILTISGIAVYATNSKLIPLIVLEYIKFSLKNGRSPWAAFIYSAYSFIQCNIIGDIETGYRFGAMAVDLIDKSTSKELKAKVYAIFYGLIKHWKSSVRETLEPLNEGHKIGLETGDFDYAAINAIFYSRNALFAGKELTRLHRDLAKYTETLHYMDQSRISEQIAQTWQFVMNLMGQGKEDRCKLIGKHFNEATALPQLMKSHNHASLCSAYLYKLILSYTFGEYDEAVSNGKTVEKYKNNMSGQLLEVQYHFYYALALIALCRDLPRNRRGRYMKWAMASQRKLAKWAVHSELNFRHKELLIEAEKMSLFNRDYMAMECYQRSIKLASESGYIQEEALANELAGKFHFSRGQNQMAETYLTIAYQLYSKWGATEKAKQLLLQDFGFLAEIDVDRSEEVDVIALTKASLAISNELILSELIANVIKIVVESAGAQRGILLLLQNDELVAGVEAKTTGDSIVCENLSSLDENLFSRSVVNYVARSNELVVLADASTEEAFKDDLYLQKNQTLSLVAMPLMEQGRLIGILYLENNLSIGAFTSERLEILDLLSSQIAISIENTRLYEQLRENRLELDKQVANRTVKLVQTNREAKALLNNLSHRIRDQLNMINGYIELQELNDDYSKMRTQETFGIIKEAMTRTMEMVEAVRQMRLIDETKNRLNPRDFHLSELEKLINENWGDKLAQKKINLMVNPTPIPKNFLLKVNRSIFIEVTLKRLIENAIKFSYENSPIELEIERTTAFISLEFRDFGRGIPEEGVAEILGDEVPKIAGDASGICDIDLLTGLMLVRRSVLVMGGQFALDSRYEATHPDRHGTTVKLIFPSL